MVTTRRWRCAAVHGLRGREAAHGVRDSSGCVGGSVRAGGFDVVARGALAPAWAMVVTVSPLRARDVLPSGIDRDAPALEQFRPREPPARASTTRSDHGSPGVRSAIPSRHQVIRCRAHRTGPGGQARARSTDDPLLALAEAFGDAHVVRRASRADVGLDRVPPARVDSVTGARRASPSGTDTRRGSSAAWPEGSIVGPPGKARPGGCRAFGTPCPGTRQVDDDR